MVGFLDHQFEKNTSEIAGGATLGIAGGREHNNEQA